MTRGQAIAKRLQDLLLDGNWIAGTNINEQIHLLDWKQATKTIGDHNSIALLLFHLNYYLGGTLHVFTGGDLEIRDKFSFDMKPINSDEDWQNLIKEYLTNAESCVKQISLLSDEKLDSIFVKEIYGTFQRNIEGLIEHSYYHFGQIALLRKLIQA